MSHIVSEEYIQKMQKLARILVMGYFEKGEMPIEQAYACSALLEAYTERIGGDDKFGNLIEEYERSQDDCFIIFPNDEALNNIAFDICTTEDFLQTNYVQRDTLTCIANEYNSKPPYLSLVYKKPEQ